MEPSKKKLKLDIINLNYKFQNLTLKRKNDTFDKTDKKIKLDIDKNESKRKIETEKNESKRKIETEKNESKRKIETDKNESNKINKKVKLELKSCGQEYTEYNKKYNKENDNDPDNESFKEYKRLPPDDMIYRYII